MLAKREPKIAEITQIELFATNKLSKQEREELLTFLKITTVYTQIASNIINQTITIRQQYKTKLPDAIIVATAMVNNLVLLTKNTSDFK